MTDTTQLTVAEQPQQLITIEPTKYVELVFEPFAKQYADAVDAVREVAYDIKTTAGMATAIRHRAVFRDIRVASEKARKLRKAPILEIGKLLDSRQGEIESTLLPLETLFDEEIKAEEARKEGEKAAKLAAEQARVAAIRQKIDAMRNRPAAMVGRPSDEISAVADVLSETVIALTEFFEFCDEATVERNAAVAKLREMQAAKLAHEQAVAEAARQAELDRIERERIAEANRLEARRLADLAAAMEVKAQLARDRQALADKQAREKREAAEAEQQAANEQAAAAMRAEKEAHERRMAAEREAANAAWLAQHEAEQASLRAQQAAADKLANAMSEIQGIQQQVIIAQSGRLGVRKGGAIECLRETLAETEAWELDPERFGILAGAAESAKTTAVAEIRRLLAEAEAKEREDAEARRQREEAEAAAEAEARRVAEAEAAEAARLQAEKEAAEREQARRVRVQFEKNGPGDEAIVARLADIFDVRPLVVVGWLEKFNAAAFKAPEEKAA